MDLPDLFPANPKQLRTIRHYNFSEVSSAMQKAIRRGDAALAGYWALELWSSGFGKYVWKRLLTISAEDCWGILTQEVKALHDSYLVINDGIPPKQAKGRIHIRKKTEDAARQRAELLNGIRSAQEHFIGSTNMGSVFTEMLDVIMKHTGSGFGFISEVLKDEAGAPFLRSYALTDISWNEQTRKFMQELWPQGMEFRNLKTLFGSALVTRDVVIANDAASDPRSGGLPPGLPPGHRTARVDR